MQKLFPLLAALTLTVSACQLGGGPVQPTPISIPTAIPINTIAALAPTAAPSNKKQDAGSARTAADGMTQLYVSEGTFQMGGIDPHAEKDEKPVHKVTMHAFWIDQLEVTNAMYKGCVDAGACPLPAQIKSQTRSSYFNNAEFNDYPVVYVTWGNANAYCKWVGRRLPSEAEWERAGRGDDYRTWPWGDERPDSTRANFNYLVGDSSRVGSFAAGASPFGVLDLAGNVAEWVNDFYDGDYYSSSIVANPSGPSARTNYFNRGVRGGTFQDTEWDIRISNRGSVLGPNPDAELDSAAFKGEVSPKIGFRCASDY